MGSKSGAEGGGRLVLITAGLVSLALWFVVPGYLVFLGVVLLAESVALAMELWEVARGLRRTRCGQRGDGARLDGTVAGTAAAAAVAEKNGQQQQRQFTWQELSQHCTADSALLAIHGSVYDVTDFLTSHPGGRHRMLLMAGRDATYAFESYHPFTDKPKSFLSKFKIGELATFEHPPFKPDSGFYKECRQVVGEYFQTSGKDYRTLYPLLLWGLLIYGAMAVTYVAGFVLVDSIPLGGKVLAAAVHGICNALVVLHVSHNLSHSGYSRSPWLWFGAWLSMDWTLGLSAFAWQHEHVLGHHLYCNVVGSDPDVPIQLDGDPRRLFAAQRWQSLYRYQHLYIPVAYALIGFKYRIDEVSGMFAGEYNNVRYMPVTWRDRAHLVASKTFWLWLRLCLPCGFGMAVGQALMLFVLSEIVFGIWMGFNFSVSHGAEETEFFVRETEDGNARCVDEEWAKAQVAGSLDYAPNSPLAAHCSGALNYQTAHHLFPSVSHVHLPKVAELVKKVCVKHGVTYNCLPTYTAAVRSHFNLLIKLGKEGKPASWKLE